MKGNDLFHPSGLANHYFQLQHNDNMSCAEAALYQNVHWYSTSSNGQWQPDEGIKVSCVEDFIKGQTDVGPSVKTKGSDILITRVTNLSNNLFSFLDTPAVESNCTKLNVTFSAFRRGNKLSYPFIDVFEVFIVSMNYRQAQDKVLT